MNTSGARRVGSAGEAFLRILADRGVPYLFGNAGTDFASIIEGFAKCAAEGSPTPVPVTVPHENLGVSMAYGCYLTTGRPQCVMLHVNVGTANALCGLANAARENIPILLAAGRTPVTEEGELGSRSVFIHWGQEMFDQAGMLREMVKWDYELRTPRQLESVVDRALSVALSPPRGPVYLTLPREVLAQGSGTFTLSPRDEHRPAGAPAPDPLAVADAAQWLAASERPLLITGRFGQRPEEVAHLEALVQRHAIPVVAYRPRYVCLPSSHPMHMGYEPARLLEKADVIVVLDCDVPWLPDLHRVNPSAKVIHIGVDPLFGRYPMRTFRCDLAITASPAAAILALDEALTLCPTRDAGRVETRRQRLAGERADADARRTAVRASFGSAATPAAVASALNRFKQQGDLLVCEANLPIEFLDLTEPGTYFGVSSAGGLGWGLGAALGAKLGAPGRRVFCVMGDGGYMFANPTPAHLVSVSMGLPFLTVILNNGMWGAVRRATLSLYPDGAAAKDNRAPLTRLEPAPRYEKIVEASGGYGERVESLADLDAALERALHAVEVERRQAVLNVLLSYSDAQALHDSRPQPAGQIPGF